jgi:hypothetical protein
VEKLEMEIKQHKYHHAPSVSGLIMAIAQTINSFKVKQEPPRCYHCDQERPQEEFRAINKKFEKASSQKFTFMVENLGLSGINIPPVFFTDESINVCRGCFRAMERKYYKLMTKIS